VKHEDREARTENTAARFTSSRFTLHVLRFTLQVLRFSNVIQIPLDERLYVRVMSPPTLAKRFAGRNLGCRMSDMDVPDSAAESVDSPAELIDSPAELIDSAEEIERQIEADPTLVPQAASALLVEPSVLDQAELEALLADLGPELAAAIERSMIDEAAALDVGAPNVDTDTDADADADADTDTGRSLDLQGASYEPYSSPTGRDRRHSKLSPFAWLFADHAGAGRPTGNQQGDHLRARRSAGKKARPAPRQTQGSLFGNRR
jgi:hypothetical protein